MRVFPGGSDPTTKFEKFGPFRVGRGGQSLFDVHRNAPLPARAKYFAVIGIVPVAAFGIIRMASPQPVDRSVVNNILKAYESNSLRHRTCVNSQEITGDKISEEMWVKGNKFLVQSKESYTSGITTGSDGKNLFRFSVLNGHAFEQPYNSSPVDLLDKALKSRTAKWFKTGTSITSIGQGLSIYSCQEPSYKSEFYVDNATWRTMEWDLRSLDGELVQRYLFDYPQSIDDSVFSPLELKTMSKSTEQVPLDSATIQRPTIADPRLLAEPKQAI